MSGSLNVAVLIFDGVEVLDFAGPFEVFAAARLDATPGPAWREAARPFEVFTVARDRRVVESTGGLRIEPTHDFESAPPIDLLLVPGGVGVRAIVDPPDEATLGWICATSETAQLTTSVCTGAWVLARAGLLRDRPATTHFLCQDQLVAIDPTIQLQRDQRVVDAGDVVTAAGVAAGIDLGLHVLARLHGEDVATNTARYIEYPWPGV